MGWLSMQLLGVGLESFDTTLSAPAERQDGLEERPQG